MIDFAWIHSSEAWMALLTLTILEIILGIDNIVFISIIVEKLKPKDRNRGRIIGLALAMIMRILLLMGISWIMGLKKEIVSIPFPFIEKSLSLSGKDLILIIGGLFLLFKSTREIHHKMESTGLDNGKEKKDIVYAGFGTVIAQIIMLDLIFSLDSVITAVGMAEDITVMIIAVMISIGIMMIFAKPISNYINKHPSLQILALSFLILIGVSLLADGLGFHIPKGYIYFSMFFSLSVELINLKLRSKKLMKEKLAEK